VYRLKFGLRGLDAATARDRALAAFDRDRLTQVAKRLAPRVPIAVAREAAAKRRVELEQITSKRAQLVDELANMREPIVAPARLVSRIDALDREVRAVSKAISRSARAGFIRRCASAAASTGARIAVALACRRARIPHLGKAKVPQPEWVVTFSHQASCGRRAGMSFVLVLVAVFLACFFGRGKVVSDLSRCAVIAPTNRGSASAPRLAAGPR
jgi:hypothetical protein